MRDNSNDSVRISDCQERHNSRGVPGAWVASPDLPDIEDSICARVASCSGVASKFVLEAAVVVDLLSKGMSHCTKSSEIWGNRGTYEVAAGWAGVADVEA